MTIENITLIDKKIVRGASETFEIVIEGDHTSRTVYLTAKANRKLESGRLISIDSTTSDLTLEYNGTNTNVTVKLVPDNTKDLQITTLEVDIESVNASDAEDVVMPASGTFTIINDVRTEFDGYNLPDEKVTFQQLDASDFEVDSLMWVQDVGGIKTMVEITIAELKTELGI